MANVISFDAYCATSLAAREPATSCIRAAAILSEACADWSRILLHRPTPQGIAFLAETRILVRHLLVLGGVAPAYLGDIPTPTFEDLVVRIHRLKDEACALGVQVLAAPG